MSAFEELGVCPEIIQAIEEDGWLLPTPIQGECIPYILGGQDVCAAAETGSGKTGAFGLPCLQIVHETLRQKAVTTGPSTAALKTGANRGFDLTDKDSFVMVSTDGLEARSEDSSRWCGIRCQGDISGGKYQFEVRIIGGGLVRVGVSMPSAALELGKDARGWGFGGTGKKAWNNKFEDYGLPFRAGDVIGVLLDKDNGTLAFTKNGEHLGLAYELPVSLKAAAFKPHVCGKGFHVRLALDDLEFPLQPFLPLGQIAAQHSVSALATGLEVAGRGKRNPLLLVLEPTRDLAIQTHQCMQHFSKYLEAPTVRVTLCVGGIDERKQRDELQQGTDIVVGTLQKISQWEGKKELSLASLKFLVLDEADDLIKNDERNVIPRFKQNAVKSQGKVQTLFFSATLHSAEVKTAIAKLTDNPVWADLKGRPTVPETVHAVLYKVDPTKPLPIPSGPTPITDGVHNRNEDVGAEGLSQRVKCYKPQIAVYIADKLKMESCMIFCRTNLDCDNFEKYLVSLGGNRGFSGKMEGGKENPYSCVVLAGMRQQEERIMNLQHFKDGDVRFLVCTDVAARGIDIKELPHLIMFTLPDDVDQWFHRVGRVGRADNMGLAISLVSTVKEKVWYHKCASRGKGCTNTRLTDQGGCCIWYDEPTILKTLEDRLGQPLPQMDPKTLSVPGILTLPEDGGDVTKVDTSDRQRKLKQNLVSVATTAKAEDMQVRGSMLIYGKSRDDASTRQTVKRLADMMPSAEALASLERDIQAQFVMSF
eukprot:Blabericola_migrator_1__210@NODE_1055_length_5577_cov_147_372414_g725_i0_p1_GENE_NODE_1055_length_5577_cov_147_372414_g725_i0NODE_1055_length_5577_cov_147_372414_g725_i0_p1_ORF_typecomplete_len761_score140_94DEAD/PF00270_29/6_7e42DEAD/PF00270_29/2_2e03Helicase_C/PF00271_31/4_7e03Helicase_C/PF00271_31/1_4e21SPRY/PF00622_28/1_4e21ResIII/PF04851_15/0_31ResIII/PF04851_15/3_7e06Helicase_RecD/PF05127_14/2_7Helicase_RecD/PF05127_14/1_1e02Scm3/PF10384_9/0_3_NODE_1055_length_5577_cov_147_372414_g725_i010